MKTTLAKGVYEASAYRCLERASMDSKCWTPKEREVLKRNITIVR